MVCPFKWVTEQYFLVVLFTILYMYKVVLTFGLNEILKCDHSYESHWTISSGSVYNTVQGGSNFWLCGWHPKVWPFKSKWLSIILKSIWFIFGVGQFKINHMWIIQQHSFYQKAAIICFIWNFLHTGTPGTPTVVMVGFPGGPGGPMGPRSPGRPRRPWSPCWEENPKSS